MSTALPHVLASLFERLDLAAPESIDEPLLGLESPVQETNSLAWSHFRPSSPTPQFRHCDVTSAESVQPQP